MRAVRRFASVFACLAVLAVVALPAFGQEVTEYIAFGDSITNGEGFDEPGRVCPQECGYPPRLEDLLNGAGMPAEVFNAGVGGESTVEGVSRLPQVLDQQGGDVLLLMEGTNDISRGISPETTIFNLSEMAGIASSRGLRTVHSTLIPRVLTARIDRENRLNRILNRRIRELAFLRGRDLADNFEVFWSHPNGFAELYTSGNDPVGHPNPQGFDLMANVFFDVLRGVDSVPPVPGLLEPPDDAEGVSGDAQVHLRLYDFGAGIDLAATELLIDGQPVSARATGDAAVLDLRYTPAEPFTGRVEVGYRTADMAPTPNTRTRPELGTFLVAGTQLLRGDLDEDGRVDGVDLIILARHFGSFNGESRYARFVDLNEDDRIDGTDLALLADNFGRTSG